MAFILAILFWAFLAVLLLLVLVLVTPLHLGLHLTTTPQFGYRVDLRLLGGLTPRIVLAWGPRADRKPRKTPAKEKKRGRGSPMRPAMVRALPRLVADLLHHIHVTRLQISADYGLDDPAATGQLSGLLMPLQYATPLPDIIALDLRPDFTRPQLNGTLTAAAHLTLAAFIAPAMRFAWGAFGPAR